MIDGRSIAAASCIIATGAAQYPSIKYTEVAEAGVGLPSAASEVPTMLSPKRSTAFKAEVIHRHGPWRSFEAVEFATREWVDWFNSRRLLEPIGNIPPAEAEQRYCPMLEQPAMAA
jgi:putative transposase